MSQGWYLRLFIVLAVCGFGAYLLYPSYFYYSRATDEQRENNAKFCEALPSWLSCKKFNLGLDLQGGVHLVMGVKVDRAVEQRADRLADAMRDGLKQKKLAFTRIDRPRDTPSIVVTLTDGAD